MAPNNALNLMFGAALLYALTRRRLSHYVGLMFSKGGA